MSLATATIVGNLGSDPEKKLIGDTKMVTFSVAVNQYRKGAEVTDWFDVIAFEPVAKFVADHVKKGSTVGVTGDLSIDKWEKDGVKQSKPKIVANSVKFVSLGGKKKDDDANDDFKPSGESPDSGSDW